MSEINTGGPAFPTPEVRDGAGNGVYEVGFGMTLRDWFAGQALAGGYARSAVPDYDMKALFGPARTGIRSEEILAADAYRLADAMLKARGA